MINERIVPDSQHTLAVREYYERNTKRFLLTSKDAGTHHIHQPLWLEEGMRLEEAIHSSINLVLEEIVELRRNPVRVLDLGCGVGSSLRYLQQQFEGEGEFMGITISPTQVEIAQNFSKQNSSPEIHIQEGDFQDLDPKLGKFDLIYAIEAFAHSPDAQVFFTQVSQHLNLGGKLVLVDDFLADCIDSFNKKEKEHLRKFKRGWKMGSIVDVPQLKGMAAKVDLVLNADIDLSSFMRIGRPRDAFIGVLVTLLGTMMDRSLYLNSLKGGFFKQKCLKGGIVTYRKLVFTK